MSSANLKKKGAAPPPSRPKSRTKDKKAKGGKSQRPAIKTVELLSDKQIPDPECSFLKWDLATVNQLIENDMTSWQNQIDGENAPPPEPAPKKGVTPAAKNKKNDANVNAPLDPIKITTETVNNEPDLPQFQPYLKEWKSLLKKKKPHIVRKGFPLHPYFEELKKKRSSSSLSNVTTEEKKNVSSTPKAKPKTPVSAGTPKARKSISVNKIEELAEQEEPEALPIDAMINPPGDKEAEEQMIEDFNKYCDFVPLTEKGVWNEAFLSATALISEYRNNLNIGGYLWERIYPKQEGSDYLPRVSQFGRYYVKIFYLGEERMVVVDDKLPQDRNGKVLFSITQKKEYWPAILMKALMVVAKGKEDLLFRDPVWIFGALCGGFIPHVISTTNTTPQDLLEETSSQINTNFRIISHICNLPQDVKHGYARKMLLTTLAPSHDHEDEEELTKLGLSYRKAYVISDIRPCRDDNILRLQTWNASWNGKYSYSDSSVWTADFEEDLGFCMQDRPVDTNLTDFWISFSDFQKYFSCFHILHNVKEFKHRILMYGEHLTDSVCLCKQHSTKLTNKDTKEDVNIFLKFTHLQNKIELGPETPVYPPTENGQNDKYLLCTITSYNWKKSLREKLYQFQPLRECVFPIHLNSSADGTVYLIEFSHLQQHKAYQLIEMFSSSSLILGSESEIFETQLNAVVAQYEERYPTHENESEWRLWFVKQLNNANVEPQQTPQGNCFTAEITLEDESLYSVVNVLLVDNDTNAVVSEQPPNTCTISPVSLPSPSYTMICYARPSQAIHEGSLRIKTISEKAVGELESIPHESIFSAKLVGKYTPNDMNELFRYSIFVGDELNMCLYLALTHVIPTTLQVLYTEDDNAPTMIWEQNSGHSSKEIVIPSLVLLPSEKTVRRSYTLVAHIDTNFAKQIFEKRLTLVEKNFESTIEDKVQSLTLEEIEQEEQRQRDLIEQKAQSSVEPIVEEQTQKKKGAPAPAKKQQAPPPQSTPKKQAPPPSTKKDKKKPEKKTDVKIPANQKQIVVEQAEETDPVDIEVDVSDIVGDDNAGSFAYQITISTTSPNVLLEKRDDQKEKLDAFVEDIESENPGRLDRAKESREQFLKQKMFLMVKQKQLGQDDSLKRTKTGVVEHAETNPTWLKRTPDTWLNHANEQPIAEEQEKRVVQKQDLEKRDLLLRERRDSIHKQVEQDKKAREEWTAKQQEKLNETDSELSAYTQQMKQAILTKQREIETLSTFRREERKQAERAEAERKEAERKALLEQQAQEQKLLAEQNKNAKKTPAKSPEKKKR